jgi:hypothetical protein
MDPSLLCVMYTQSITHMVSDCQALYVIFLKIQRFYEVILFVRLERVE